MFSTLRLRPPSYSSLLHHRRPSNKRHLIQNLNEAFLDLAVALPYPPHWPAYSATIILVTVVSRTAILPVVFWSTRRQLRYEKHVLPALRELKPVVMHEQAIAMQREGLLVNKETRAQIHAKRCRAVMKTKSKELEKLHRCSPVSTAIMPIISQAPLFVIMTMVFARLAADPVSPFDSESFLTLSTLNHPDPTFALPVVLGLVTMANVESSHWVLNAEEKAAVKENEKKMKDDVEKSGDRWTKVKLNLRNKLKDSMRVLSILRIGLASVAPGAVTLYWVTSAVFGLGQTWLVNWLEIRQRRKMVVSTPPTMSLATLQAMAKLSRAQAATPPASGSASSLASLSKDTKPQKSKRAPANRK